MALKYKRLQLYRAAVHNLHNETYINMYGRNISGADAFRTNQNGQLGILKVLSVEEMTNTAIYYPIHGDHIKKSV